MTEFLFERTSTLLYIICSVTNSNHYIRYHSICRDIIIMIRQHICSKITCCAFCCSNTQSFLAPFPCWLQLFFKKLGFFQSCFTCPFFSFTLFPFATFSINFVLFIVTFLLLFVFFFHFLCLKKLSAFCTCQYTCLPSSYLLLWLIIDRNIEQLR